MAEVRSRHSLTWSEGPLRMELAPTEEGSAPLRLSNTGNLFETVRFRLEGEEWEWRVEEEGLGIDNLRIGPGGETEVTVHVRVHLPTLG